MKKLALILTAAILGGLLLAACPEPAACPIDFEHDPNRLTYRSLGSFTMTIADTLDHYFTACDPDTDNGGFTFELLSGPPGMQLNAAGHLRFSPSAVGIYYADVGVSDIPVAGPPGTDAGSIAVRVVPANRPPVITGCASGK